MRANLSLWTFLIMGTFVTCTLPAAAAKGCDVGGKKCTVAIDFDGTGKVTFDPTDLRVPESEIRNEYCVIFELPNKYFFNPAEGDGVVFKDPTNAEFYESGTSNGSSCSHTGGKEWRRFWWKYLNYVPKQTYRYKIQFRDAAGKVYSGDPTITNLDSH